jgi:hypothetical protein
MNNFGFLIGASASRPRLLVQKIVSLTLSLKAEVYAERFSESKRFINNLVLS